MTKPDLKVVELYQSNARDPVATLHKLAEDIEAGEYGHVSSIGVVLLGKTLEVFGMGDDAEATSIGMLLHAGFMRMSKAIEECGR